MRHERTHSPHGTAEPRHNAGHSTYMAQRAGSATISPVGEFVAGSFASFELVYIAGYFGIDDTGSLKIVHRFASDMGRPQFDQPSGWNYVTAEASNGAVLQLEYDGKRNLRPWDKTLMIRVLRGFLREGDTITVRLGDARYGSPGMRVQTFVEPTFEFKVLVDPWATYNYVELPDSPTIDIVAGPPVTWKAVLPTLRRVDQAFSLGFKGEDRWGNPSHRMPGRYRLAASMPVKGLPEWLEVSDGTHASRVDGLSVTAPGDLVIEVRDEAGRRLCASNPLRVADQATLLPWWADLHGQSEETIGTNSARELIEFARDRAFLDAMSHQGNDFQITSEFWHELNRLTAEYNQDGRFVIFPGYEWSGNTGLGGDRNVLFREEGRQIHRSHHGLVEDLSDAGTDAHSAGDLFEALKDEDCVVFAHIGGRYADIAMSHDARVERSVEVHSDWGTFEWLIEDAFRQGYRVGILANSDGHKGRHGASHPGASLFGAYGGLSCLLAPALTRDALLDALRRRHHYATTGSRVHLDVRARFESPVDLFTDDPALGGKVAGRVGDAMMGDIVRYRGGAVRLEVQVAAGAPIERIEIRNGLQVLETLRPFLQEGGAPPSSSRLRMIWEGSEYRGRGRQTVWDGSAVLDDNRFTQLVPINLWNLDKRLMANGTTAVDGAVPDDTASVSWQALTTGGFGGFDALLADPLQGRLRIDTKLVKADLAVADIGFEDTVLTVEGGIGRRIRVFRLPQRNDTLRWQLDRPVAIRAGVDNPLYVRVTFEDGHLAWSSPIYLIP
jgi:hypothetical protein